MLCSVSGFFPILINGTDDQTHAAHCVRLSLAFLHPLGNIAARDLGDVAWSITGGNTQAVSHSSGDPQEFGHDRTKVDGDLISVGAVKALILTNLNILALVVYALSGVSRPHQAQYFCVLADIRGWGVETHSVPVFVPRLGARANAKNKAALGNFIHRRCR